METNGATLGELVIMTLYLGSVTFLIGAVVFFFLCKSKIRKFTIVGNITMSVVRLILSISITLFSWFLWPFSGDIMFGFIMLPALFAEIVTIPVLFYSIKLRFHLKGGNGSD